MIDNKKDIRIIRILFKVVNAKAAIAMLAVAFLPGAGNVEAQKLPGILSGATSSQAASNEPKDPLNRTTPRDAIYAFLAACHNGDYAKAAHYLDLRKMSREDRLSKGPELAKQLGALLDRDTQFEVEQLSDQPGGKLDDGLSRDLDDLETFQLDGNAITLQMQRVSLSQQPGLSVWLVSADSIARIPELYDRIGESPIEKHLPAPLVEIKFVGTSLWIWLALIVLALILSSLSRVFSRLVIAALKPLASRYAKWLHARRMEDFIEPLRVLLVVVVFRACMEFIAPSALLRFYLTRVLSLLFFLGAASFVMRIVDVVSDHIISRLDARQRALSYSVLPLGVRVVKIIIFCFAVLFILESWGYNTNAILAGLGVGGVALALASQKTIENLFGGVSVIIDKPVLVGDFCNFGGQVGTIEDIGLRSTRIRTLDRTVVTIPNSTFSTMTLENYSKRDRMWFHPTLSLRRGTTPGEIQQAMDAITKVLEEHPQVDQTAVPVRFTKITPQSFDLELFAYVLTADSNEFLRIQTELLLKILDAVAELEILFAVPLQEAIVTAGHGADKEHFYRFLSEAPADGKRAEPQPVAPSSADNE